MKVCPVCKCYLIWDNHNYEYYCLCGYEDRQNYGRYRIKKLIR
jgi:hypothetical protein